MRPGFGVAILIILFIVGEYVWKNKRFSLKEFIIVFVAAVAAGAFAGLLTEGALGIFNMFMQGKMNKH